jgi:hypothetical protein
MCDFLYSIGSYKQKCEIFGQICPTGHPTIPPKDTLPEVGYLSSYMQEHIQNREDSEVRDENENPTIVGLCT